MKQLSWNGNSLLKDDSLYIKKDRFAIGQRPGVAIAKRPGRFRVLGCWGDREADIPSGKTHELWVPEPADSAKTFPISKRVRDRFHQLADQRTDDDSRLPFEPRDTRDPANRGEGEKLRLRVGDMVYFDVNREGTEITEVSFSAIWRGRVEYPATGDAATAYSFFSEISPDLLPFNWRRKSVSVAELLMGFTEDMKDNKPEDERGGLALASRLRFADALPTATSEDLLMQEIPLKILASPKPPCPVMYFKKKTGSELIGKQDLGPQTHIPQGRKWYLHAKSSQGQPWATGQPLDLKTKGQKNKVQPIRRGTEFFFHIDFNNLTRQELGLLLYALAPDPSFHHKIGMGKPLGLGTVKIETLGFFPVPRMSRYSVDGLRKERYVSVELTKAGTDHKTAGSWPARYSAEGKAPPSIEDSLGRIQEEFRNSNLVPAPVHKALMLLGSYEKAPKAASVHYPTTADQPNKELEHFEWFVQNDTRNGQFLKPLATEKSLPPLLE